MSNDTMTDAEAQEMRDKLAAHDRQRAFEAQMASHQLYLALKPIVETDEFADIHAKLSDILANGPKDNGFFGSHLGAAQMGMTNLGIYVTNWKQPVDPNAPVPAPVVVEGSTNGQ